ncbi:MAG: cytochrome P450 [Benniella sp.]|nr:MAG: cytochrome P450 [Benniella sp.]
MVSLSSGSSSVNTTDILKIAIPIGIGLASVAYFAVKYSADSSNPARHGVTSVPTASLREGELTHDVEYNENQDAFIQRCEEAYGPMFNVFLIGKTLTVASGPLIREVFMNNDFSSGDDIEEVTSMMALFDSMRKSNIGDEHKTIHALVRDYITPNLAMFTPAIVKQLESSLDHVFGTTSTGAEGNLVPFPMGPMQTMVSSAMVSVFMGLEAAQSQKIIDIFNSTTMDMGMMFGPPKPPASFWQSILNKTNSKPLSPLQIHVRNLTEVAGPIILERRRLEEEAAEKGIPYDRPMDILQRLLDNFDKHGLVDVEDICGYLLILSSTGVHTTNDTATTLLFYLAAFPEHLDTLYKEQRDVLDAIQQERTQRREALEKKGEPIGEDLDPAHDRDLTAEAIKRMVHLDSFIREMFRYRTERLTLSHRARKTITLSNGVVIPKGQSVIINMKSAHHGPDQGDDVTEFRPWRFVGKAKSATKAGADFLPFGMGKHACPGRFLAIHEVKAIIVLMVSKYSKFEIQDPSQTMRILRSRIGEPAPTGLIFHNRVNDL